MERTSISVRLNVISVFVCSSSARISKVGRSLIGRTMTAWLGGSEMARIVARQRFFSNNWGMNDGRMISPQKPSNPFRHGISHSRELCSLLLVAANQPSPAVQSSMNHPVSVSSCIYYPTLVSRLICRLPRSHLRSICTHIPIIEW